MLQHVITKFSGTIGCLHPLRRLLLAAVVGALATLLLLGVNQLSLGRGGGERVGEAFSGGALVGDYLAGDTRRGKHQFNDCLILGMALDQRAPVRELAVSPTIPFAHADDVCEALQLGQADGSEFYHRYLHGHTTLVRFLLPVMSVEQIRGLYRMAITVLLLAGIGIGMLRIARGQAVREHAVFLVTLLCFSRFFGLEMFGQSLGHGPADAVLVGYIGFLAVSVGKLSARSGALAAALFGALTMVFEFLTGGLPLGLAAVLGLSWFALKAEERSVAAVALGAASYLMAAGMAAVTKLAAVATVFGPQALAAIGSSARERVSGALDPVFGERTLLGSILSNMEALAPGLGPLSTAMLVVALAAGAWAVRLHWRRDEVLLLAASNLPILLWPLVFRQHMTIHAWFMDRIFVWTIASGFALFLLAVVYAREAAPPETAGERLD